MITLKVSDLVGTGLEMVGRISVGGTMWVEHDRKDDSSGLSFAEEDLDDLRS